MDHFVDTDHANWEVQLCVVTRAALGLPWFGLHFADPTFETLEPGLDAFKRRVTLG